MGSSLDARVVGNHKAGKASAVKICATAANSKVRPSISGTPKVPNRASATWIPWKRSGSFAVMLNPVPRPS